MAIPCPNLTSFLSSHSPETNPHVRWRGVLSVANNLLIYHDYVATVTANEIILHHKPDDSFGDLTSTVLLYRYPLLYCYSRHPSSDELLHGDALGSCFLCYHGLGCLQIRAEGGEGFGRAMEEFRRAYYGEEKRRVIDDQVSRLSSAMCSQVRASNKLCWLMKSPQFLRAALNSANGQRLLVNDRKCKVYLIKDHLVFFDDIMVGGASSSERREENSLPENYEIGRMNSDGEGSVISESSAGRSWSDGASQSQDSVEYDPEENLPARRITHPPTCLCISYAWITLQLNSNSLLLRTPLKQVTINAPSLPALREFISEFVNCTTDHELNNASELMDSDELNNALWSADWDIFLDSMSTFELIATVARNNEDGKTQTINKKRFFLSPGSQVIGSNKMMSDIVLMGDPLVTPKHCRLVCSKSGDVIVQTISDQDVFVNGVKVKQPWPSFKVGDWLKVGSTTVKYVHQKESIRGMHSDKEGEEGETDELSARETLISDREYC